MSNELVKMEEKYNEIANIDIQNEQLVKETFFKGCTDNEIKLFQAISNKTGLSVVLKQIYPVKRWNSELNRMEMVAQISIDGYRLLSKKSGCLPSTKETMYSYDKEGNLFSATAYVQTQKPDSSWFDVPYTCFYSEYCAYKKDGTVTAMWKTKRHMMLSKCAEAGAHRKAAPEMFSSVYTEEEMEQADNPPVQILEVKVENAPVKIENTFNPDQFVELKEILKLCSPTYQESVKRKLIKLEIKDDYSNMPKELYEKVLGDALARKEQYAEEQKAKEGTNEAN